MIYFKLLEFNPNKKIDVNRALEHTINTKIVKMIFNYVKEFHIRQADNEIIYDKPIHAPIDGNVKYYAKEYRKRLYDEDSKKKKKKK